MFSEAQQLVIVKGHILTFTKNQQFLHLLFFADNCNYSKNANVHAAVVAGFLKSVNLQ